MEQNKTIGLASRWNAEKLIENLRKVFQNMDHKAKLAEIRSHIQPMELGEATRIGREAIDEMMAEGANPDDQDIRMLNRLVIHGEAESDRTWANILLLVVGALLITMSVVVGTAGAYHAFHAHPEAKIIGVYAAGFMVFGWTSLLGVRK